MQQQQQQRGSRGFPGQPGSRGYRSGAPNWSFVFDPAGRLCYYWSMVVSLAFLYNFWVIIYRFAFQEINGLYLQFRVFLFFCLFAISENDNMMMMIIFFWLVFQVRPWWYGFAWITFPTSCTWWTLPSTFALGTLRTAFCRPTLLS